MKSRHDRFWKKRTKLKLLYKAFARDCFQNFKALYPTVLEWHKQVANATPTSRVIDHKRRHMGFSYPYGKDQTNG